MMLLLDACYLALLLILSPWLLYAALRQGKYREGYAAKLLGRVPRRDGARPAVWLHAVSVGEVNLLKTILEGLEREFPEWEYVITTTTKTGYDLARRKYAPRTVCYCPLDFSWAVRTALRRIRPELLILAELELWPNLIRTAHRRGVRVAIVNGRLSENSYRGYRRIRPLVAGVLQRIDLLAVQNDEYAARFRGLGARPESLHITGSLKFDGAQTDCGNPLTRKLAALASISPEDIVFLAGSTQEPEESLALDAYRRLSAAHPRLRLILVPRHPARCDEVAQLLDRSGLPWQRRSRLDQREMVAGARILLVDTVGELGGWWGLAQIAFVGGSMGRRGGQNMIEPAAYGAAVCFGPNTRNFRDVVALFLRSGAASVVGSGEELAAFVQRCLIDPVWASELGGRAQQLVAEQRGATTRTVELLATVMGGRRACLRPDPPGGAIRRPRNCPATGVQQTLMSQLKPPAAGT